MKLDPKKFDAYDLKYRHLRTPDAAKLLGLSGRTLEKHRTFGTGPQFLKIGGRVVYRLADLLKWIKPGYKSSTSDTGRGSVLPATRDSASQQMQNLPKKRRV